MADEHAVLTVSEAQAYYNRFGKKQDSQGFYEDPVLDDLIAHASFQEAQRVFEFGCGTGKFAARLLAEYLPASATYLGCDVSPVMIGLAAQPSRSVFPSRQQCSRRMVRCIFRYPIIRLIV